MKKLFTLCLFTMALFLGTQSISAQENARSAGEIAKVKTHKLIQEFNVKGDQKQVVWRAFLGREKAKQEIAEGHFSESETIKINEKVGDNFNKLMEQALGEQQYIKFKLNMKEYL